MVDFLYSMNYDTSMLEDTKAESPTQTSPLQFHARMFALGDRYDISGLRGVAANNYRDRCAIAQDLEIIHAIHDVYERTPASITQLRTFTCKCIQSHLPKMINDATIRSTYQNILIKIPEFSRDLLDRYVEAPLYGTCGTCCSSQAFEVLQVRCKKCGKGSSGWGPQ